MEEVEKDDFIEICHYGSFWVIWLDRNGRLFADSHKDVRFTWGRIKLLTSLCVSKSMDVKE